MLIGQAGSIGGKTRQEVEVMQWEQENSGKEEAGFPPPRILAQTTEKQDVTTLLNKVLSHMASTNKNNGLIMVYYKS